MTDLQQDAVAVAFWGVLRLVKFGVLYQACKQMETLMMVIRAL